MILLWVGRNGGCLATVLRVRWATGVDVEGTGGGGSGGGGNEIDLVFFSFFTSGFFSFFFTSVEGGVAIIFLTQVLSSSRWGVGEGVNKEAAILLGMEVAVGV